jgi:RNA polymerase sigma factor (sigma-70 family)
MDDDALQLAAWRAGDADAGRRLVKTYYRLIFRFFYGKTADSACEDLTQETFEILVRRRDAYRGDSPFRAYLYGIARNVLVGHIRRKLRHGDRFEPAEQSAVDPASEGSFSSLFASRQLEQLVAQALRSLSLDDQIVIELKDWEGLTQAELAALFELPQPTIARRLQRARVRLREAVERLIADPALRAETVRSLESCMRSILGKIEGHLGKGPDGGGA